LRVGSIIILAHLLAPEDFGLIGMVTALTVFAKRFKDLGHDIATIQSKEVSQEQVTNLFWLNFCLGLLITLLIVLFSPFISHFYNEPRLVAISLALSAAFFFSGLTIQHQALLRRQMRFAQLAGVQTSAVALGVAIGIWCAWQGFEF
jgi:PST family polysaccharide transporter